MEEMEKRNKLKNALHGLAEYLRGEIKSSSMPRTKTLEERKVDLYGYVQSSVY